MNPSAKKNSSGFRRALDNRCPDCGEGKIMVSWFKRNRVCPACGVKFEMDEGDFLGAMAINYGLVVFGIFPVCFLFWFLFGGTILQLFVLGVIVAVVFPILIYPVAWRIWVWVLLTFMKEE